MAEKIISRWTEELRNIDKYIPLNVDAISSATHAVNLLSILEEARKQPDYQQRVQQYATEVRRFIQRGLLNSSIVEDFEIPEEPTDWRE